MGATPLRRWGAVVIDLVGGMVLAVPLSKIVGFYFAGRAVVTFAIGSPDTLWKGGVAMALGAIGTYVYVLPLSYALLFAVEATSGGTPGKRLFGLRVIDANGRPVGGLPLATRTAVQSVGLWGMTLALITGSPVLAVTAAAFGIGGPLWLAFSGRRGGMRVGSPR